MKSEKLTTKSILKAMNRARLINADEARRINSNLQSDSNEEEHPLVAIARNLPTHAINQNKINLEQLCEWFAQHCELPYHHS